MKKPRNIVITGASSGIGAALAAHYAAPGITLYLQGRDVKRLEKVAETCRKGGAAVQTQLLDVTDAAAMQAWLAACDAATSVDLVIANAGVSAGSGLFGETGDQVRRIFAVNIDGVINTIQPLLAAMLARKSGQIAIVSSLAGLRGLPSCPAYSASKACVLAYGEGLRGWLKAYGVKVSVICPGYIRTPMTDNNPFPMPFMMDAGKAARIIAGGLAANRSRIAFPLALYLPLFLVTRLPPSLTDWFFARLPAKPAAK